MALLIEGTKDEIVGVVHKACPFCGNMKLYVTNKKSFDRLCEENGASLVSVKCRVCDTEMSEYSVPNNNYWMGMGMLIGKWNTRNGGNVDGN